MMEPERDTGVRRSVRIPNWTTLALVAGLIILVLVIAYLISRGNPNQDKLTANQAQAEQQAKAPSPEKLCASPQTYDLIKRELFRRAAQLRGSDEAAFDQLSAYAVLRMENPVMESDDRSTGAVNCSGSLSLDLPPGVAIVGHRRTLSADVDYTVQPAADGTGNVVLLRNADSIVAPLATLARTSASQAAPTETVPPSQPVPAPGQAPGTSAEPAPPAPRAPSAAPPEPEDQNRASKAGPSFDCRNARTKGEIAVCSDAGLAALDRNMAAQYRRAIDEGTPDQKALLRRTRDRFLGYRDRCPNRSCIGDAYVGRMREIRDIMQGRWQPPR